jgi:hypothetical protein
MSVDLIVTNVQTSDNAKVAETYLQNIMPGARVLHLIGGGEELQWLLYSAATSGQFIIQIPFDQYKQFSPEPFISAMQSFQARFQPSDEPDACGRVRVPTTTFPMWFSVHNRHRYVRVMTNNFKPLPKIALLVPMTLRGISNGSLPILSHLRVALSKTFAHCLMIRGLYLGIDEDEHISTNILAQITRGFSSQQLGLRHERTVKFPSEWRRDQTMARMYNELFRYSMMDGYDFAIQLQDDARPETSAWDKIIGSYVCANPLAIGAYSLQDRYAPDRFTNILVSRTHFDIFGYLFNPQCLDTSTWIKNVLGVYARIVSRTKVSNTIRTRRCMNGTARIYRNYGLSNAAMEQNDREHFERVRNTVGLLFSTQ